MGTKAPPGQGIADLIASGEMDPAQAMAALHSELGGMLGESEDEPDELQENESAQVEKQEEEARRSRVAALGFRLDKLAQEQVALRQTTEERWFADVRQYNGQYEPGTFSDDAGGEQPYGSRVFVPLTRRLVNLCEARLFDVLFQDKGFVLKPTPVPDLDQSQQLAERLPADTEIALPDGNIPAGAIHQAIKSMMEEAQKKNDAMQREIEDQLAECKYQTHARNSIHDAVLMGTGVMKGPFPLYKTTKRWKMDETGQSYELTMERKPVPVTVRVDPWNFFPDMSATTVDEAEFVFERHFMSKKQLSALKDMPDVDLDALRQILGSEPGALADNHRERLRAINGANGAPDKRYQVWEYHGPITDDDLEDCGCEIEEEDPLEQYTGTVWFCEGIVIKAALNPLDTGALPYRVFTWQKDESNIFGFGLPYEVRDQQTSANSSFRAMLDNMGLCVKPQVGIDDSKVEPANGAWDIEPGKFWRIKSGKLEDGLRFIDLPSRVQELQGIFLASKSLIEEVGTLPAFLQGQEAPAAMQSATQASIAWTAANLWVRRCVRNWDDDIISPLVGDYYDWNMQYSSKDEIKGDSRVQALGIAALVELEGQAQKMQAFISTAAAMGVPLSNQMMMLRQFARAFKLDPDLMLPDESEIAKMKESEGPKVDVEQEKLKVAQENNQLDAKSSADLIEYRRAELADRKEDRAARMQQAIAELASNERITIEQARAKYGFEANKTSAVLADKKAERDFKGQAMNAELQVKTQMGSGI